MIYNAGHLDSAVDFWDTGCEIQCGILGSVGGTIQAEKLRCRPQKSRLVVVGPLGRGWVVGCG